MRMPRFVLVLVALWSSSVALAQPVEPPSDEPAATPAPSAPVPPAAPAAPYAAPQQQPRGLPQSVYDVRSPRDLRRGFMFEAGAGVGVAFTHDNDTGKNNDSHTMLGLSVGVGYFVTPDLAIGLRSTGTLDSESADQVDINGDPYTSTSVNVFGFIGPAVQYWLPRPSGLWLGGGFGWGFQRTIVTFDRPGWETVGSGLNGFGLSARGGYTFTRSSTSTINLQVEMTTGFMSSGYLNLGSLGTSSGDTNQNAYTFALMVGYQHL